MVVAYREFIFGNNAIGSRGLIDVHYKHSSQRNILLLKSESCLEPFSTAFQLIFLQDCFTAYNWMLG